MDAPSADLEHVVALDDVEPLVLLEMHMPRRTALAHVAVLEQEYLSARGPLTSSFALWPNALPHHLRFTLKH